MQPYAVTKGAEKKKRGQTDSLEPEEEEYESENEEEDDNISNDPMIKVAPDEFPICSQLYPVIFFQVKKATATEAKKTASTSKKDAGGSKQKSSRGKSKAKK